jgi:transcription initiation factor IIE alpha subunit
MTNHFLCPECRSYLDVGDNLVFSVESDKGERGLIFLHSELGNYSVQTNSNFKVEEGKKYEFFCPVCNTELATEVNENLSKVIMIDPQNNEYEVLFSKIAGEKSTYTIIGENVNMYGEDYGNYVDFINLSHVK